MTPAEHKWFTQCKKIALKNVSATKLFNFGAVLVKGGSILSTGYNVPKCAPIVRFWAERYQGVPQQLHAEMSCLQGVQRHIIRGCDVYVARIKLHDHSFAIAKPCAMCEAFLRLHGIRRVYYSIKGTPNTNILEWGVIRL